MYDFSYREIPTILYGYKKVLSYDYETYYYDKNSLGTLCYGYTYKSKDRKEESFNFNNNELKRPENGIWLDKIIEFDTQVYKYNLSTGGMFTDTDHETKTGILLEIYVTKDEKPSENSDWILYDSYNSNKYNYKVNNTGPNESIYIEENYTGMRIKYYTTNIEEARTRNFYIYLSYSADLEVYVKPKTFSEIVTVSSLEKLPFRSRNYMFLFSRDNGKTWSECAETCPLE